MARNSHLTEDQIKFIFDSDASKVEQDLYQVIKETQTYKDRQKELNRELQQAQIHPRKNAEQIKLLKDELKKCSNEIKAGTEKMKALEREMGVSNLSMSQLKRRASDLQRQLDRTSKNLHPEEWNNYNKKLAETRQRILQLKAESYSIKPENMAIKATALGNVISNVVMNATTRLRELAAEGIKMAESADGVQRAFNKLDSPALLDNLRTATKGTVNDLQLMQAAVKARDFRIPLEDLGKYLAYAQLKAQETGQSVEYLTDSIIMGLGRQSKQILDNLGLSAAEISEEVAKAGDFVAGVTAIVDRQLANAGEAYVSAADKATQATVSLENAQLRLGQALLPLKERFDQARIAGTSLLAWIVEYRKLTVPVISVLAAFALAKAKLNTQTTLGIALSKTQNALQTTGIILGKSLTVMYQKMTGHKIAAARAQLALNAAMAANPWGFVLTALTTALSLLPLFKKRTDEATESLTAMDRVNRRMADSDDTSIQRIQHLNKVIHDETAAIDLRREALAEARKTVPGYHAELTQEGKLINDNVNAITSYVDSLKDMAKARAIEEEMTEQYKLQMKLQQQQNELDTAFKTSRDKSNHKYVKWAREHDKLQKELDKVNAVIDSLCAEDLKQKAPGGDSAPKSLIKELEEQRKALVEARDTATSEQDIAARNREIEAVDAKIQRLQNLGKTTKQTAAEEQTANQELSQQRSLLLEQEKQAADTRTALLKQQLDEGRISQAEYDVAVTASATQSAQERLAIEQQLQNQLKNLAFKTAAEREKAEADAAQRVLEAETAVNKARTDEEQTFRNNLKIIRESGALEHEQTLAEQQAAEMAALDVYYKAALQQAGEDAQKQAAVKQAYLDAIWRITQKYAQKELALEQANEKNKQQLREQLGLVSWKASLDIRLQLLDEALQKQAITEEEYSRKSTQIWMEAWHEQASYFQDLAGNAFESLQQAEMDMSAAKYDVLISQAKKAGQDTTALEEEKEAKQLEIQKKYADVNFAVKASQIIADTAVAIMQAYGQLGPIAGTVAAVLMGIVGAAQLASANAERQRVKQLQVGSSSGSSSGSNTRVLTGHEKGGRINVRRRQDGKLFRDVPVDADRRGYIDRPTVIVGEGPRSKEFVVSNAAVENPTVAPLLNIIDKAQMAGNIRTLDMNREIQARMIGRGSGGSIDDSRHRQQRHSNTQPMAMPGYSTDTLERLDETLRSLQRDGIAASVALTEIDRKRELRDRARSIGSKR